jgi:hypothetical protein
MFTQRRLHIQAKILLQTFFKLLEQSCLLGTTVYYCPFRPLHFFTHFKSSFCLNMLELTLFIGDLISTYKAGARHRCDGEREGNFTIGGHVPRRRNARHRMKLLSAFYSRDRRYLITVSENNMLMFLLQIFILISFVCCKSQVSLRSSESRFVEDFGIKLGFVLRPILHVLGDFQFIFLHRRKQVNPSGSLSFKAYSESLMKGFTTFPASSRDP